MNRDGADSVSPIDSPPPQFGIAALLWTTVAVAITLAYIRLFGDFYVRLWGAALVIAPGIGILLGLLSGRWQDAIYWSVLGALFALICVAGHRLVDGAFYYGWVVAGSASGGIAGVLCPGRMRLSMIYCALAGAAVMSYLTVRYVGLHAEAVFDTLCAATAGVFFTAVIEILYGVEQRSKAPRYVTATCLLAAMIGGNFVAALIMGERWYHL